jgi:hypothetical protein
MIEISHRCPSCGASVRDRDALFCPECGKPLSAKPKTTEASDSPDTFRKPEAGEIVEVSRASSGDEAPAINDPTEPAHATAAAVNTQDEVSARPAHRRGEKTRERLHRASEVARGVGRGVIEEPAKRVEKIRQASTVVIEEASYDPSLRFVLVALGLFVVFVVLLVLSKVMG